MATKKGKLSATNMVYGLGAALVIIGALFKIQHWPFASLILTLGMVVEALVFTYSAFERQGSELDWTLVYPELAGGNEVTTKKKNTLVKEEDTQGMLSKKLDKMLHEAKIDAELMSSLGTSIKNFEGAAKGIAPSVDAMASTKKYSEEMSLAAAQMESLNSLYKVQVEAAGKQAEMNNEVVQNTERLKVQMDSLATNLSSLNGVYGGMLSAMNKK
ncbi:MAG: gliding motility protein GldL [Leeuwenhoekiella sp.]